MAEVQNKGADYAVQLKFHRYYLDMMNKEVSIYSCFGRGDSKTEQNRCSKGGSCDPRQCLG
jgi:hypothetical protein